MVFCAVAAEVEAANSASADVSVRSRHQTAALAKCKLEGHAVIGPGQAFFFQPFSVPLPHQCLVPAQLCTSPTAIPNGKSHRGIKTLPINDFDLETVIAPIFSPAGVRVGCGASFQGLAPAGRIFAWQLDRIRENRQTRTDSNTIDLNIAIGPAQPWAAALWLTKN